MKRELQIITHKKEHPKLQMKDIKKNTDNATNVISDCLENDENHRVSIFKEDESREENERIKDNEISKKKALNEIRNRFYSSLRRKSDMRMIVFLFHHYGLHFKTILEVETIFNSDNNDWKMDKLINYDFHEHTKITNEIRVFDYFELPVKSDNIFKKTLIELLVFIADKSYPLLNHENIKCSRWCKRVFWCTEERKFEFTSPQKVPFNEVRIELLKQQVSCFNEHCLPESEFKWIKTKRSAYLSLFFLKQYISKLKSKTDHTDYIIQSISYILSSINSSKSIDHVIMHIKTIVDILPIDIKEKITCLQNAKDKWSKTPSILPIYNWLNKNNAIYNWIYKYISETIFNSKIPAWVVSNHNWNQLKSQIEMKNEVRNILYILNDISSLNIYDFSFVKLKKSAQKHIERSSNGDIKISISNLRLLDKIARIMNIPHNELLTDILKNELARTKPSKMRIPKNQRIG